MKARPRSVERRTAEELSNILAPIGMSKVERLPVIGRTGPDISINETRLVIDVKSRKCIPERLMPPTQSMLTVGSLVIFRLNELLNIPTSETAQANWKQLFDWYAHMDKWTQEFKPAGITAIFLHRPRMPIGHTGIVIHINDLQRFKCQLNAKSN